MPRIRGTSLGRKFLIAFAMITAAPVVVGMLGWMELRDVARSQATVVAEAIPAISQVRGIVGDTSRAVVVAPELAAVTTDSARAELRAFLTAQVDALRERIDGYESSGMQVPSDLMAAAGDLDDRVNRIDRLVRQRISAIERRDAWLGHALAASAELLQIADTLVANAEMSAIAIAVHLYEFEPEHSTPDARLDMLDKLIEVDLFQIRLMLDLRAHAAEVGLLLSRLPTVQSLGEFNALRAEIRSRADILGRRVLNVQDPSRAEQAMSLIRTFHATETGPPATGGLFEAAQAVLEIEPLLAEAQEALRDTAHRLDQQAANLADRIESRAAAAGMAAESTIRRTQLLYAWGAALTLLLSALVMWLYVHRNMVRRLDGLAGDMLDLAEADASASKARIIGDEITRMEGAVQVFRQQAAVNRQLQAERERMLHELWEHRNELQRLVDGQTEALRLEITAHAAARARAEAADQAKSEFLAMMSHEIRTPMNGVLGMLRSLSRDRLTPRQKEWLRAALTSGKGLMDILNSLLDTLKTDRGALSVDAAPFRLTDMLRDIVLLMAPVAEEKGLWLRLEGESEQVPPLMGDAGKLRQILFNLVSNAIKFTDTGGVTVSVACKPREEGRIRVAMTVADTGCGIHPDAQARIFEAFTQEDSQTARTHGGTGLGLTICRRLADLIGAEIALESRPGAGARFTVTTTLDAAREPAPGRTAAPAEDMIASVSAGAAQRRLNLLVVEDNDINQRVIESFLDAMGHDWDLVATGAAAIVRASASRYDAILMDVNLPDISGTEATRQIRALPSAQHRAVPVIGVSAHVHERDLQACMAAGMNAMVPKPVMPADLAAALARVVPEQGAQDRRQPLAQTLDDLGAAQTVQLVELFLQRLDPALAAIAAAADEGDLSRLERAAHQLKGAAGNFDLPDLCAALGGLCDAALAGDLARARACAAAVPSLAEDARRTLLQARDALGDQETSAALIQVAQ
ncbi:response regulator [Rhodobacteraceae bacterium 2376]|uniref:histidine kinase n=1 Tax=Rhabdonatronobacter sediminivivens TaxID=2743469 RepID=A0A7Z0I1U1_9RHOB|nr:ATP-binding protein [Rhabdonatronobacter sediminivivens]NYS26358.1 response regulator [Rhabdonatronobacter sediminivivens]